MQATVSNEKREANAASGATLVKLSHCASEYAQALANPYTGPLACVPNFPALPTRKVRTWARGTFATGTAGFGYIVMSPMRACVNDTVFLMSSFSTYTGTTIDVTLPTNPGVGSHTANADYVTANIGPSNQLVQPRLVAAGLRVRYIGTELDRGGQLVGLMEPNHQSLAGVNFGTVDGYPESRRLPPTRTWCSLLYRPVDGGDLNFFATTIPGAFAVDGDNYMAWCVQAPGAAVCTLEFEAYCVFEYIGRDVRGKTPSHVDNVGFGAVHAATQLHEDLLRPNTRDPTALAKEFKSASAEYAGRATTTVQKHHATGPSGFDWASVGAAAMDIGKGLLSSIF